MELISITQLLRKFIPFPEPELITDLEEKCVVKEIPAGTTILQDGAYVASVPMILEGRLKVMRVHEDKELLLYYIEPGESCIMSFAACLSDQKSHVMAIADTDIKLLLIPAKELEHWIDIYPSFSKFLFALYDRRYTDLLLTVDQLLNWNLEDRTKSYLQKKALPPALDTIHATHQEIAHDLGVSREAVSRVLKKLEQSGQIKLGRNEITLI